jgi:hypothetical protein
VKRQPKFATNIRQSKYDTLCGGFVKVGPLPRMVPKKFELADVDRLRLKPSG